MPEECPHGMPDPAWCSTCKHGVGPRPRVTVVERPRFRARYDGQCPDCDLPIGVGQWIVQLSTGAFVHEGCAEDPRRA